jgi:broad specificity phosphatase PhoE
VIALPEAQEISEFGADTGSNPGALAKAFGGLPVDLSLVHEGWNSKTGKYGRSIEAIDKRAEEVRTLLWVRPEKEVVLVSHMGFLHHLTDDWEGGLGEFASNVCPAGTHDKGR